MTDARDIVERYDLEGIERGKFVVVLRNHDRKHFKIFELPYGQTTEFDDGDAERKWLHPELGLDHHLVGFFEIGEYESADDLISIQQNSINYLCRDLASLRKQLEDAREVITEANNSLYGSHGYFLSLDGGPPNKYHLAEGIEKLKSNGRLATREALKGKS